MTEPLQPSRRAVVHATDDLFWYYCTRPGLLDLRAASMEPGSGAAVWDDERLWNLHASRVSLMKAAAKGRAIEQRLGECSGWSRQVIRARWDSFGGGRLITASMFAYKQDTGTYLGIALILPGVAEECHDDVVRAGSLIDLFTTWAMSGRTSKIEKLRTAAYDAWKVALREYANTRKL